MNQSVPDNLQHILVAGSSGSSAIGTPLNPRNSTLRVSYCRPESAPEHSDRVLAEIRFGDAAGVDGPASTARNASSHLCIQVGLEPLTANAVLVQPIEIWEARGAVECGQDGAVRYAHDGEHLFAVVEVDERAHGGILAAAEFVYSEVRRFQLASPLRHLLRMWNYADAVNEGSGDMERYRQFCVGRARGLGDSLADSYPAASAVGRQQSTHLLQVYWLAARSAGVAVENPRQISAYRYPQSYGPVSPSFSRATIAPDHTLLISGTASILGHASHHPGDVTAQLDETLRNLDALIAQAAQLHPDLKAGLSPQTCLKVYVRNPAEVAIIEAHLHSRLPNVTAVFLAADICRRELLVEIECMQRAETTAESR